MAKLVALDIDGTFIDDSMDEEGNYYVSQDNIDALNQVLTQGDYVLFASGRSFKGIERFAKLLKPSSHIYASTSNGTCLYDYLGHCLNHSYVPFSYLLDFIAYYGMQEGDSYMAYLTDGSLGYLGEANFAPLEAKFNEMTYHSLDNVALDPATPVEKVFITLKNHNARSVQVPPSLKGKCEAYATSDFFFEIVAKGVSKAASVASLAKILKIKHDDIYTFGDGANDLKMIQEFKGTAPSNAIEEVRQAAQFVSKDSSHSAIAYALKEYWHLI